MIVFIYALVGGILIYLLLNALTEPTSHDGRAFLVAMSILIVWVSIMVAHWGLGVI